MARDPSQVSSRAWGSRGACVVKELTKLARLMANILWAISWVQREAEECNPSIAAPTARYPEAFVRHMAGSASRAQQPVPMW
jgi:hypothetical protein